MTTKNNVEVCFTPEAFKHFANSESISVVVDILRATSAICTAFDNGVKELIPVATLEEAQEYKNKGFLVAAERDGIKRDFADFGNSPFNFTAENVKDKTIVYSTTNGTEAIHVAASSHKVVIGSFLNLHALVDWLKRQDRDVIILCAAWKNKFNLEDTLFAGALSALLIDAGFETKCDSANASMDLWEIARKDIISYIEKTAQRHRLKKSGLDDVIEYCFTQNTSTIIPVLKDGKLIKLVN